jgi:hypothetical protein
MVAVGSTAQVTYSVSGASSSSLEAHLDGRVGVLDAGIAPTQGLAITDQVSKPLARTARACVSVSVAATPSLRPRESFCYPYTIAIPAGRSPPERPTGTRRG